MLREKGLVVDGFLFSTNKEYNNAIEEQEAVAYFKSNSDLSKSRAALKLYSKLTENRTFHTPVGYTFLKELQDFILKSGIVKSDQLEGIYIPSPGSADSEELNTLTIDHFKQIANQAQNRNKNSRIINIFLVLIITVMIGVAIYSDKTVYTNFENKVVDKYATWEEELNNREQILNDLETKD